jgi:arginyl-tRNA--protein-N-Asp/Glu arginylyltransferase
MAPVVKKAPRYIPMRHSTEGNNGKSVVQFAKGKFVRFNKSDYKYPLIIRVKLELIRDQIIIMEVITVFKHCMHSRPPPFCFDDGPTGSMN